MYRFTDHPDYVGNGCIFGTPGAPLSKEESDLWCDDEKWVKWRRWVVVCGDEHTVMPCVQPLQATIGMSTLCGLSPC